MKRTRLKRKGNKVSLSAKKRRLRADFVKSGFDLNKEVNFWGQRITLSEAIKKMDKDDIVDSYKLIRMKKEGVPII